MLWQNRNIFYSKLFQILHYQCTYQDKIPFVSWWIFILTPYCFDDKRFLTLMEVIIQFLPKNSISLHTIDVKLMGLQLSALFLAPFLNTGETYVIFQSCGIHLSSMILFRRRAKGLDRRSTNSIKIWGCFSSGPHYLYTFSFNISFRTIFFVIFILARFTSVFSLRTGTSAFGCFVKILKNCF